MKKRELIFTFIVLMFSVLVSCENEDDENGENKDMSSSFNDDESHNAGQNCMACHKSGGQGEGWFTVAGTVYNASKTAVYPNATVKLYTGPDGTGTLVKTIEVDGNGNFYTTANVNFGGGLYTTVTGTTGNISKMGASITTGQCNSCHGSGIGKISAN
jgi:cytochrome c553